jgi:putative glutamine amidotransferase
MQHPLHHPLQHPLIGITCGEITNAKEVWAGPSYGQRYTYIDAVAAAGGVPLVLPLVDDECLLRAMYDLCDGFLMAGGNDVDPAQYGQEWNPKTKDISPRRDEQELQLLRWALDDDKAVLGICRGMQLLNVELGGNLFQDISSEVNDSENHVASVDQEDFAYLAHGLKLDPDSRLAKILEADHIETNALHHQAVNTLGDGLVATGWAEDDVIEAIELPVKRFVLAVQSHPEALTTVEPKWQKLFRAFVENSKK